MGASVLAAVGAFLWRFSRFTSAAPLESPLSREGGFLGNNLLLLAIAFVILWGVTFPLFSQAFGGAVVSVARPYYDQVAGPLFLALIFLMGVGPFLPWRQASWGALRRALGLPLTAAAALVVLLLLTGIRKPWAVASFGLCAFVAAGVVREWLRGTRARRRKGEGYLAAFLGLIGANRPRYGGYIVHLAVVLLALGVTGSSFYSLQRDVALAPGGRVQVGDYTLEYQGATAVQRPDRVERRAQVLAYRGATPLGPLTAGFDFYPDRSPNTATRAGIRSTPLEDLYVIASEFTEDGRALFRVLVNPLVFWIWVAGPVLVLGALVSLWPERERRLLLLPTTQKASPQRELSEREV
jgi:cytochrome c-type biogenesis protein CcmF